MLVIVDTDFLSEVSFQTIILAVSRAHYEVGILYHEKLNCDEVWQENVLSEKRSKYENIVKLFRTAEKLDDNFFDPERLKWDDLAWLSRKLTHSLTADEVSAFMEAQSAKISFQVALVLEHFQNHLQTGNPENQPKDLVFQKFLGALSLKLSSKRRRKQLEQLMEELHNSSTYSTLIKYVLWGIQRFKKFAT